MKPVLALVGNGKFAKAAYDSAKDSGIKFSLIIGSKDTSQVGYWDLQGVYEGSKHFTNSINSFRHLMFQKRLAPALY